MLRKWIVLVAIAAVTQLTAWNWKECGDFGVGVDYLYWQPSRVNFLPSNVPAQKIGPGDVILNSNTLVVPTYQSGVRGEAWFKPSCVPLALIGRYYWVEPRQGQTFFNDPLLTPPEFNRLDIELIYHAGDVLLGYDWTAHPCVQFRALLGAHALYFADNTKLKNSDGLFVRLHRRIAGGGASFGGGLLWSVWRGLETFGELRYGIIVASAMSAGFFENLGANPIMIINLPTSVNFWTRTFDLRAGARYSVAWSCAVVSCQLGWECRSYLDLVFTDGLAGLGTSATGSAMGGPFVGLSATF